MKRVIYFSIAMMGLSAPAFAQQLVNKANDQKPLEKTINSEITGGFMNSSASVQGAAGKKQPGLYIRGIAESDKMVGHGSLALSPAAQKQPMQVYGDLGAYRKLTDGIKNGSGYSLISGARMAHSPVHTQVGPAIGWFRADGWSDMTDHRILATMSPVGYFNSNIGGRKYNGMISDVDMAMHGTAGNSKITVTWDLNLGMLYGGSQKTGENGTLKQRGVGISYGTGMMFGYPVMPNVSVELGFATNTMSYKTDADASGKRRFGNSTDMFKIGVKARVPAKVKGRAAKVL